MLGWDLDESHGRLSAMEERWKILYNEQNRSPTHSVAHYITYLRRYVSDTGQQRTATPDKNTEAGPRTATPERWATRAVTHESKRSLDSISPMSYFIRKLKLDLKMSFPGFVEEFVQAPNNGLRLLLSLLKNLQTASSNPIGSVNRAAAKGTLRMEEYKQCMVDEQDCLLCIKYTLRIRSAVDEILEHNNGLFTVTTCLLSNFFRSRITALEILTLIITGPSSVDKVLDAFTSMRIKYAESTRFKMLINMMHTRGVSHVLFQVTCLRLLNTLLNFCKSANMRVFLQYEMEEAGLDWDRIQEGAQGVGLEYDDLRREIGEWKLRYIDVDSILRKIKADLKAEFPGNAISEFHYDQHYGPIYNTAITDIEGLGGQGRFADTGKWSTYVGQKEPVCPYPPKQNRSLHSQPTFTGSDASLPYHNTLHIDVQPPTPERENPLERHLLLSSNDNQPVYESISRTPSPAVIQDTRHSNGTTVTSVGYSANDDTVKRFSITSEICEPYGLVIKTRSNSHGGQQNENGTHAQDKNWIFATPGDSGKTSSSSSSRKPCDSGIEQFPVYKNEVRGDRYDSGVSVTYPDNEPGDEGSKVYWENFYPRDKLVFSSEERTSNGNNDYDSRSSEDVKVKSTVVDSRSSNIHGNTPRSFLASRQDSIELGPLRWYNPGITPPRSFQTTESHQGLDNGHPHGISHKSYSQQEVREGKPRTPTPDYNIEDMGDHEPSTSQTPSDIMRSLASQPTSSKPNSGLQRQTHVTSDQHSNFQRSQNVRKKSLPDIHKTPPRPPLPNEYKEKIQTKHHEGNMTKPNSSKAKSANIKKAKSNLLQPPSNPKGTYPRKSQDDSVQPAQIIVPVMVHIDTDDNHAQPPQQHAQKKSSQNSKMHDGTHKTPIPAPRDPKPSSTTTISSTVENAKHRDTSASGKRDVRHNGTAHTESSRAATPSQGLKKHKEVVIQDEVSIIGNGYSYDSEPESDYEEDETTKKDADKHKLMVSDPKDSSISGADSIRSYSAEIGRVLSDLDQTLETHGWQASLKKQVKQQRPPLVAYV